MRILREPLLHFLAIGAAIFILSLFVGGGSGAGPVASPAAPAPADKQIIVTPEKVALLRNGYVLDHGTAPTDADLQRLIDAWVREEILVREARAQGLDQDDSIVRRRLVQKMEFAVADPPAPPDSELEQYLAGHPTSFRRADGTVPSLSEIHGAVLSAWMSEQRNGAMDEVYQKYRRGYQVAVQMPPGSQPRGGGKP